MRRTLSNTTTLLSLVLGSAAGGALVAAEGPAVESTAPGQGQIPTLNDLFALDAVVVKASKGSAKAGYRVDSITVGPLGAESQQGAPFSISTVSSSEIENLQALNVTEALKYVPTVYNSTGGSQITPYFTIRGLSASTWTYNMAVDGRRSFDIYQPLEDKERIEVLSGVNSLLYGVTSPAGAINYVLKRPTEKPFLSGTLGNYDQQVYGHVDMGGPIKSGLFGNKLFFRLNVLYGAPGDTGVEHQSQERYLASGVLDWHVSDATVLSLNASWSKRKLSYAQTLFLPSTTSGVPAAPDASMNWGAPYTGANDSTARVGAQWYSRLSDVFSIRANIGFSKIDRDYFLIRQEWQNASLAYRWRYTMNPPFTTDVAQYGVFGDAVFSTGSILHKVTLGSTFDHYQAGDNGSRNTTYTTTYPANLYVTSPTYPAYQLPAKATSSAQKTAYTTFLFADRIDFSSRWSLLAGGNLAKVDDRATSTTAAGVQTTAPYAKNAFCPTAALSFTPVTPVTLYLSFGEGLQQGFVAPSGSANAGEVFSPYITKQFELGAKTRLGGFDLNAALFKLEQANQYTTGTGASMVYSQDGKLVNNGFEVSFSGKLLPSLTAVGGATLLDSKVDKANANVGQIPQGVAKEMARLYLEYSIPFTPGLTLTGGASYNGRTWVDAANLLPVPSVLIADAGVRYECSLFRRASAFRFSVANLTGKDYWTTRNNALYLGSPRTVTASMTMSFN